MTELFKTLRLAFYVCALPLVATAIASAHSWINLDDDALSSRFDQLQTIEVLPDGAGTVVSDANTNVSHVLKIDEAGGVTGRIMTRGNTELYGAVNLNVTLNLRGNAVARTSTGLDGQFRFESVEPGAYTFIASSPDSVTTFGVYVYADDTMVPMANEVQLSVAAANSNADEVRGLLNSDVQSVSYSYTPTESELPIVVGFGQHSLDSDGSFSGRVVPLQWLEGQTRFNLTGNYVYLFDGQGMAAKVPVDADGYYSIGDVNPGIYDFVSFGPHGAAALSIEITAYDSVASNHPSVSFASTATNSAALQGAGDIVLGEPVGGNVAPPVEVEVVIPPQQPGGGFGGYGGYPGGGYGGGGGGGGFGDFGSIIGMALAAWVLTEAFDRNRINDGGGVITPPIVLPPVVIPPPVSPSGAGGADAAL